MALKVYRTPIGFHDAYVAAYSQKAALQAWGADANLFARGMADTVTDPALTAEPLARPGEVVKRLRGSAAEQLAAAPPVVRQVLPKQSAPQRSARSGATSRPKPPPPPRPDRHQIDVAQAALTTAQKRQREVEHTLAVEEAALAERRSSMRHDWQAERVELEEAVDAAEERYTAALKQCQAAN